MNLQTDALYIELDTERKIRTATSSTTAFNHWPIWIFVFFIAPGPLTFDLFERGFDARMALWLGVVLLGTGIAGLRGRLPGVEPRPTSSASPRIGRTRSIGASATRSRGARSITFAVLNIAGLVVAIVTGEW